MKKISENGRTAGSGTMNQAGNKIPRLKRLALAVFAGLAAACIPAMEAGADSSVEIAKDVKSWLQEHGQSVVETDAQHYNTAGRGIYTGGSLSVRTPNYYITPVTISAPDIHAGCGGVDLYFGSFSYLKKEELERFARQVMANTPYFAFKIALDSYFPKLNATLAELQSMAQLLSSTQLDACSTSEYMANSLVAINSYDDKGNYVYRPRTLQNTWDAIYSGIADGKDVTVDVNRQDGSTMHISKLFSAAGLYKEQAKANAGSGGTITVNVPKPDGSSKPVTVEDKYQKPKDLAKVQTAAACGKGGVQADDVIDAKGNETVNQLNQDTILCKEQSGLEGNQVWLNQQTWLPSLMAQSTAKASGKDGDVISILKSFNGKQDELFKFFYSTMGAFSQVPKSCTDKDPSSSIAIDRTLTLAKLVEGGEYAPIRSLDYSCGGDKVFYQSNFEMETSRNMPSPVTELMKEWGNYCDECPEKSKDIGKADFYENENTPIAKIFINPEGSNFSIPKYDEMTKILGEQVMFAVSQHARNQKVTTASNIARYCLSARIRDIYYQELLGMNDMVYQSIVHTSDLAQNTRKFLRGARDSLSREYNALYEKYGDSKSSCIYKAGGYESLVNAQPSQN